MADMAGARPASPIASGHPQRECHFTTCDVNQNRGAAQIRARISVEYAVESHIGALKGVACAAQQFLATV